MRRESGFSYLELLIAALVLAIATVGALATWSYSSRAPANKRVTEMGVYVATQEIERLKARRYMGLEDTPAGSPLVTYYDRYGAPSASGTPQPQGYKVKAFITPAVDRDATPNTEDLREIRVEVWDNNETTRYEEARVLLAFGGS